MTYKILKINKAAKKKPKNSKPQCLSQNQPKIPMSKQVTSIPLAEELMEAGMRPKFIWMTLLETIMENWFGEVKTFPNLAKTSPSTTVTN